MTLYCRPNEAYENVARDVVFSENILLPDDLPRLFPGPLMPPPLGGIGIGDEQFADNESGKGCCGFERMSHTTLIKCFIIMISLIGLACVVVGIVLGALTVSGSTRLTLCLLMIGELHHPDSPPLPHSDRARE